MTTSPKNCRSHPDDLMLTRVSLGKADITERMIVEAHLHYCSECSERFFAIQQSLVSEFNAIEAPEVMTQAAELDPILLAIKSKLDADESAIKVNPNDPAFKLLPPSILDSEDLKIDSKWNSFWPSKGKVSLIASDRASQYQLFLGVIDPGATLPGHNHDWNEQTLVLQGQYVVGDQVFEAGDWSESTVGDEHSPSAGPNEHCFCLIRANKNGFKFTGTSRWRNVLLSIFN